MNLNPEQISGLNGIRTHVMCDTDAVLCQLNYQANWKLATSWVRNTGLSAVVLEVKRVKNLAAPESLNVRVQI